LANGNGTYIRIDLHRGHRLPNDGAQGSALRSPIARLFAPGLRTGRRIIWNGEELQPYSPGLAHDALSFPVHVHTEEGQELIAQVTCGPCDVSLENSKLAITYSYRVVEETRDGFGDYQGGGLAGWVALGEEWRRYLTTTKDGFADENLRNELMTAVASGLRPMLERLREQRASSMFAQIAVRLEATLGGLFKVDVEGRDEREAREERWGPEHLDEETPITEETADHEPRRREDQGATEIQIQHGTDSELDGRLVAVSVTAGKPIVATVNAEHPHIITALEKQPVNQMLLVSFIVSELSKELVKSPTMLTKTKLYTRGQYDELVAATGGEGIDLLPYVSRRLLDRVAA
jgi:hypothetical protein